MAAGLDTLGDDAINAPCGGRPRLFDRTDLHKNLRAPAMRRRHIRGRISPEEHNQRDPLVETRLDLPLLQSKGIVFRRSCKFG